MTPPAPNDAARAAAQRRLQATHAALAAALGSPSQAPGSTDRGEAADGPRPSLALQLAEQALAPWATERPWTLMAAAAAAGALLASRRGRGLVGSVALAVLLAPRSGRGGLPALGAAGFGWLLRRRLAPPGAGARPPR